MAEGTPVDGSGLGFPIIEADWLHDAEPEDAAPQVDVDVSGSEPEPEPEEIDERQEEEAPVAEEPEEVEAEETEEPEAEAEPEEAAQEQPPRVWAGKFNTVEDLERAYAETTSWNTRVAQENSALREALGQRDQLIERMAPIVQAKLIEDNPEMETELLVAQRVNEQVQQRMAPLAEQQQQAAQQQAAMQQLVVSVAEFRNRHPEIAPNSPEDVRWATTLQSLNLNPTIPAYQELAVEAMNDQALFQVLRANPHYVQTQEGLEFARQQAAQLARRSREPAKVKREVRKAFVETGSSGAPVEGAPGERREPDQFDAALDYYRRTASNPIMGGGIPSS